jgi:hypothetical protein
MLFKQYILYCIVMHNNILFLHIPHTCGRLLKRILTFHNVPYNAIHNEKQFNNSLKNTHQIYFILRNPLERCVAEFVHYSFTFVHSQYQVNNLSLPCQSFDSIENYYSSENRCNLTCKYLLQKPFDSPITDKDFDSILQMNFHFDIYSNPLDPKTLSSLANFDIKKELDNSLQYGRYLPSKKLGKPFNKSFIVSRNFYDVKLFNHLNGK